MSETEQFIANTTGQSRTQAGTYTVSLSRMELKSFLRWAGFKAMMDIVHGVLCCLGIITAVFGIPRILSGIRLLNALDDLKYRVSIGNDNITPAFQKLENYFKLSGISIVLKAIFLMLSLAIYIFLVLYLGDQLPDMLDKMLP